MNPFKFREAHGPEWHIREDLITFLEARGWHVEIMHGSVFQNGIPDLLAIHPKYGHRFIDVKVEGRYTFTGAQRKKWPIFEKFGMGVWILVGADDPNYDRLFNPPNWRDYYKDSWRLEDESLDRLTQELRDATD